MVKKRQLKNVIRPRKFDPVLSGVHSNLSLKNATESKFSKLLQFHSDHLRPMIGYFDKVQSRISDFQQLKNVT